jgi:hypothetical protein
MVFGAARERRYLYSRALTLGGSYSATYQTIVVSSAPQITRTVPAPQTAVVYRRDGAPWGATDLAPFLAASEKRIHSKYEANNMKLCAAQRCTP